MFIQVNGKQIDVGDALRTHVEEHFGAAVTKYAERPTECIVTFSRDRHEILCDALVHLSTGLTAKARGRATEPYAAAADACDRLEKQLRRYKRRLKDHHKKRSEPVEALEAPSYVISSADEENEPDSLQPVIIAETKAQIKSLSVGEAVMQMEMADETFLVFRNEANGGLNVVYRRQDGNIGWIDPANLSRT
ncbi:ribosome hibernation-promoting factor, HPF/YfiA family [Oceanicella actignis]|uniref:Ribosome hibernation promoting factor n=1 Tax=Oceanicella actignis TaxID=1189325 RepID=A0A1M7TE66_9RHOB|nr:ribosome-associated translation inhibitor RaiA [Oceanicella actignis]TYO88600.1 ribosomal subunit interface protein [Oceanicella actignis]SET62634.1 SSU ribosomal protein S30P/sigma 54 modulation protein [Oceanicella actignis]SHN69020.1 ribosomal subunit interface protein [Oceanicella actignis]